MGISCGYAYIVMKSEHTYYKEKTEVLLVTSKKTSLEVNAEKIKYMLMLSCVPTAAPSHNVQVGSKSLNVWQSSNI